MAETKFKSISSHGTYFQLYSYKNISDESEIGFARKLTIEAGVTAIPLSAFYKLGKDNRILRFCFAKKENTLKTAVERLRKYLRDV
jgi:methionine aminotransferase